MTPSDDTTGPAAQLVVARLPRAGIRGLAGATGLIRHIRAHLLAPGGYLVTIIMPTIRSGRYIDRTSVVIAAAKAAGLTWQQQILHIRGALPEPALGEVAPDRDRRLAGGRHKRVHDDLFVFTSGDANA